MQVAGWSDAGSPFCRDWPHLTDYMQRDAGILEYTEAEWPNWPTHVRLDAPGAFDAAAWSRAKWAAAKTLGLSAERWPPPQFDAVVWRRHRPRYEVVASGDVFAVGNEARVAREHSFHEFKNNPTGPFTGHAAHTPPRPPQGAAPSVWLFDEAADRLRPGGGPTAQSTCW